MKGFFITATDTGVGKTVVTLALLRGLQQQGLHVCGMKPIASGSDWHEGELRNADALAIQTQSSTSQTYRAINPYAFVEPIAPHIAAQRMGVTMQLDTLVAQAKHLADAHDLLLVEGVGGWQVPLTESLMLDDLARALSLPVILVVGLRLGCINHALLTQDAIQRSGLPLHGWVANTIEPDMLAFDEVLATLQANIRAPLLGLLPLLHEPEAEAILPLQL
jgi:dethiobiotin synthetase